jgi:uncharacterized membrane-anchored protein
MALAATIENQSQVDGGRRTRPKFAVTPWQPDDELTCLARKKPRFEKSIPSINPNSSVTSVRCFPLLLCLLLGGGLTQAASGTGDQGSDFERIEKTLQWRQGEITIGQNLAKLNIPPTFRFLGPKDANVVLTDLWGNPPEEGDVLGMIFPVAIHPGDRGNWGIAISYEADGYVKDGEAASIDYNDLLKQLQKSIEDQNIQRTEAGYPNIHLIGWATPPHYDRDTHKLYWAKKLSFDNLSGNTLNYNIRVLGRRGVLVVNIVAPMERYPEVERQVPQLIAMVDFTPGNRYTDFTQSNDTVAAYGLIALIAGSTAVKGGFFKGLLTSIPAKKKLAMVGSVALCACLLRLFRLGKPDRSRASSMARK